MTMFDLAALDQLETGLGALALRTPAREVRGTVGRAEAPDQVRGGVCPMAARRDALQGSAAA